MTIIAVARPATYDLEVVYELRDPERRPDGWSGEYRVLWVGPDTSQGPWQGMGFFPDDNFTFTEFPS